VTAKATHSALQHMEQKILFLSTVLAAIPLAIRKVKLWPHQISVFRSHIHIPLGKLLYYKGLQLSSLYIYTQGVTGGKDQTSGGCSLC